MMKYDDNAEGAKMSFKMFVLKHNKIFIILTITFAVVYFFVLRKLFPVPSFYADSFTWVGAAKNNQPVSFRPIGYSKFIQFFKLFSSSDVALIAGQYLCNVSANLFLFLTCTYIFGFNSLYKGILFALLICHPFYALYSNYVYADAFFCSLTVVWFTLLLWLIYTPSVRYVFLQLAVLALLFMLRYNAIVLPFVSSLGILVCRQSWTKKAVYIITNLILIAILVFSIIMVNKKFTGTKTFSAFSGWQMANNAMFVLRYERPDTLNIDKQTRGIIRYVQPFFDTTAYVPQDATAWYMWHPYSPFKKYMQVYAGDKRADFRTWNALGPLYKKFGTTIILKYPTTYLKHFVLPNCKAYFLPPLETYETYMENMDTIAAIAATYFRYKTNKTPPHHPLIYAAVFKPWQVLFTVVHVLFFILTGWFFVSKQYRKHGSSFTKTLLCFSILVLANFSFVVLLAPTVLRYHTFILTLAFPYTLYLLQQTRMSGKAVADIN